MKRLFYFLPLGVALVVLGGCGERQTSAGKTQNPVVPTPIKLAEAIERAKVEGKFVLLEFGSSDACPPCEKFERDVFSKPEFLKYQESNVIFLRADFPFRRSLPAEVAATNDLLSRQFNAVGFPTFIALDHEGKEIWRLPAKDDLSPSLDVTLFEVPRFIALLETLKTKSK